ncbi:MAG: BNR-4 repeat-containing protein [Desulfobacterales bacterium]|nr:BNR-4 repeat-containing protein [Desulfobacterales bacterium]
MSLLRQLLLTVGVSASEGKRADWIYDNGNPWHYRKSHVINSAVGAGTLYQKRIVVHRYTGVDGGEDVYVGNKCRADFGDIRFHDGVNLLDYWMQERWLGFATNGLASPCHYSIAPRAVYYNNKTFVAYQGASLDPYAIEYDHTTETWSAPVQVGVNPLPADSHGTPAIFRNDAGYLFCFYGCHDSAVQWAKSNNTDDISAWTDLGSMGASHSFPIIVKDTAGYLYLFLRGNLGGNNNPEVYFKSSDAPPDSGDAWGGENFIIDFTGAGVGEPVVYVGNVEHEAGTPEKMHMAWMWYDYPLHGWWNVYHAYLNLTDGHMYSIDGTDLGVTITFAEAEANCKVHDTGAVNVGYMPKVHVYAGIPYIIWNEYDGVDAGFFFSYWTGAAWTSPQKIVALDYTTERGNSFDFIVNSATNIEAYLTTSGLDGAHGGDIEKWDWNGVAWAKDLTILTECESGVPLNVPQVVYNFDTDLKVIFSQFDAYDFATLIDVYAYGDNGFVGDDIYAIFWVEVAGDLTAGNVTIYLYYGRPLQTSLSDVLTTFIKGDDGVTGNYDEATVGSAVLAHPCLYQASGNDGDDDAWAAGRIFPNWNWHVSLTSEEATGTGGILLDLIGLYDAANVSNILVNSPPRRFIVRRYVNDDPAEANKISVLYLDVGDTWHYWDGSGWVLGVQRILVNGTIEVRLYAEGTNLLCDILSGGVSIFAAVASIAIASVKAFSTGYVCAWAEPDTDHYFVNNNIRPYITRKYVSPEPAHGVWGSEETP